MVSPSFAGFVSILKFKTLNFAAEESFWILLITNTEDLKYLFRNRMK